MLDQEVIESVLRKYEYAIGNYGFLEERLTVDETYAVKNALEEIQKYRRIGTVKECQELKEKQREKKVEKIYKFSSAECPLCEHRIEAHASKIFCPYCGQKVGWGVS